MNNNKLKVIRGVLNASRSDLNLRACLRGGMSFRWTIEEFPTLLDPEHIGRHQQFTGVLNRKILILSQHEYKQEILYEAHYNPDIVTTNSELIQNELIDYFRLNTDLKELYKTWSNKDKNFKERVETYSDVLSGIRVLRQDPVENLFSFICSSNNHIKRITQMVNNMCINFGEKIGTLAGNDYYAFPTIERLSKNDVENKLKNLSFGYRGKFISKAAKYLVDNNFNEEYLLSLREKSYEETHKELVKIYGVGNKVADCVCLMSMDKLEAIPVDTHVLSIAINQYKFCSHLRKKDPKNNSLSKSAYNEIGNKFRELWGPLAGWTQTIMFIDDLRQTQKEKSESLKKSASNLSLKQEFKAESIDTKFIVKEEPIDIKFKVKDEPVDIKPKTEIKTEIKDEKIDVDNKLKTVKKELIDEANLTNKNIDSIIGQTSKRLNNEMTASPARPNTNLTKRKKKKR